MTRPEQSEYAPYYHQYVAAVDTDDLIGYMERQMDTTHTLLSGISEETAGYRYAPGKWSVKELVGHLIDTEYVFTYRVLSIARNDKSELPGMDENEFARNSRADQRSIADLAQHLYQVRQTTLALLRTLNEEELARAGVANSHPATARALAFSIAGHEAHHVHVLQERYLTS